MTTLHIKTYHEAYDVYPLCGTAMFDRDDVLPLAQYETEDNEWKCWECSSIAGVEGPINE